MLTDEEPRRDQVGVDIQWLMEFGINIGLKNKTVPTNKVDLAQLVKMTPQGTSVYYTVITLARLLILLLYG